MSLANASWREGAFAGEVKFITDQNLASLAPKQAFESHSTELAGEPLIQYPTCFKRACFEGEGSQVFLLILSMSLANASWREGAFAGEVKFITDQNLASLAPKQAF
ncbi:hypothetical protein FF011L_51360 [Roseimaritima multifibrata]|uniref:Uncharacterized protein n=1 Tax=Roseimaritima multifibrata TaxID=1930274 RepID=A0A517MN60_9BACT|nr:hypothetical protein FF011L_51360 [Roseimaritima multifibrata]